MSHPFGWHWSIGTWALAEVKNRDVKILQPREFDMFRTEIAVAYSVWYIGYMDVIVPDVDIKKPAGRNGHGLLPCHRNGPICRSFSRCHPYGGYGRQRKV